MKNFILNISLLLIFTSYSLSEEKVAYLESKPVTLDNIKLLPKGVDFRGWGYIAGKLLNMGVPIKQINKIYASKRMPRFTSVSFSLNPKESKNIYRGFLSKKNKLAAKNFLKKYSSSFQKAESKYKVPKEIIAAILMVESHFGKNTGASVVVYRLSRLANIASPNNLKFNYKRLKKDDPKVSFQDVVKRAKYLEDTFAPEIAAAMQIAIKNKIDIFNIKGSRAGAFGWPQFLPSSYLKLAVDFNQDGKTSLFNPHDAIGSIANYLSYHGWGVKDAETVIWKYNKSQAYIDTVLAIAKSLKSK